MVNKLLVVAVMLLAAMSARAQIGYKGQVALGVSGGISNVGGFVGTARIGGYLSEHSILGAGMILTEPAMTRRRAIRSIRLSGWE